MKSIIHLLFLFLFVNSTLVFAYSVEPSRTEKTSDLTTKFSERGVEIRYYVFDTKPKTIPSEIVVDNVKYALYKTKEEAIETVKYSGVKKDYTVVYVVSNKVKSIEIIAIVD
ncbi:MAG: hypothetical protein V4667_02935 [Bacteroidota bacterium]